MRNRPVKTIERAEQITAGPPIEASEVLLEEFMAAFEIAGCFAMKAVVMPTDDLDEIPYGGTE